MPFCKLTGTCVRCARELLSNEYCRECPSRDECEYALRGLEFIRNFEFAAIAVIPDLATVLIDYISSKLREVGDAEPDVKAESLVRIFLAITSTLTLTQDITAWMRVVFKPETIRAILSTSLNLIVLPRNVERALEEYANSIRVASDFLKNLFKFLLTHYITRYRDKPFVKFVQDTFSDLVVYALSQY